MQALIRTDFVGLGEPIRGKVRDIYDLGDKLLLVATDRVSAFDVVMNEPVPEKGKILTRMSIFWYHFLNNFTQNHLITANPHDYPKECRPYIGDLVGRSMLVKKCVVLPVEVIVRGYLSGSGWAAYQKTGEIEGIKLPQDLIESQQLPSPILTPSTKAGAGEHDENISFEKMCSKIGSEMAHYLRDLSLKIYAAAAIYAKQRGIIIADTKLEFGRDLDGQILLVDEVLTPDSSRFWPLDKYEAGRPQESFDKQPLRDYLNQLKPKWNKKPPPPPLPPEVILGMDTRYRNALNLLMAESISNK